MGDRGISCSCKMSVFTTIFVGLTAALVLTMTSLRQEVTLMSKLSSALTKLDGRLPEPNNESSPNGSEGFGVTTESQRNADESPELDHTNSNVTGVSEMEKDSSNVGRETVDGGPTEMDILETFRTWDSEVGCVRFKKQNGNTHLRNTSIKSLQNWDPVRCEDLQRMHASVLVKEWTWIPDAMNGFHTCSCGLTCTWTKSAVVADDPDVLLYESSNPPKERKKGDPLRAYVELEAHRTPSHREDIFVSYHASADVQTTYASNALAENRNHFISPRKRADVLVYWSSSRCVSQRQEIASRFLPLVSHHSFGKCLNNVGRGAENEDPIFEMYPECKGNGGDIGWTHHIHCAMSHYMFALAIENTRTESYVTEKLFYALEAGTVPIYFGAPNVLDFVPPNSIIQASQFETIKKLVAYVKETARNPVKYAEFHAWRRCGELGNYRQTRAVSFDTLPCRLCATISTLGGKNYSKPL